MVAVNNPKIGFNRVYIENFPIMSLHNIIMVEIIELWHSAVLAAFPDLFLENLYREIKDFQEWIFQNISKIEKKYQLNNSFRKYLLNNL